MGVKNGLGVICLRLYGGKTRGGEAQRFRLEGTQHILRPAAT